MNIITLVENTSSLPEYKHKHGLSFYVETANHKLLFDLGSNDLFLKNAEKLNIDITAVDTVIISHGHKDHGGALNLFLQKNQSAKVYLQNTAFDGYYANFFGLPINVGLDSSLKNSPQIILTDDSFVIDDEIRLFSDVTERECYSLSNNALFVKTDNGMKHDEFRHEQNLIISEKGKHTLIAGCAHNGIINIKKRAEQILDSELDFLISGFHLFNPISRKCERKDLIQEVANELKKRSTKYYTCHCTGQKAFEILKNTLGAQITYLSIGSSLELQ